jgi:hypothetical protein
MIVCTDRMVAADAARYSCGMRSTYSALLLLGCLATTSCGSSTGKDASPQADAAPEAPTLTVRGPTLLTPDAGARGRHEPSIAIAPDGRVAACWITIGNSSITVSYAISRDRGVTWDAPVAIPLPSDSNVAANASLAARPDGSFALAWVSESAASGGVRSHVRVFLAISTPGSSTFGAPVQVTDEGSPLLIDQPHVASLGDGTLVVTYTTADETFTNTTLVAATSAAGTSFRRTQLAAYDDGASDSFARPCAADGRLYVQYLHLPPSGTSPTPMLRVSDDGGATFPSARVIEVATGESVTLAPSNGCVARGKEVWVLYGLGGGFSGAKMPLLTALRLAHSSDGGATIDQRLDVHDPSAGLGFLGPQIALEPDGAIDVTYYAGAKDGDVAGSYRWARLPSGATEIGASTAIASPMTIVRSRTTTSWIGDYQGLAFGAGTLVGAFIDTTGAAGRVAFFAVDR